MLLEYIEKALEKARYKKLKDGEWFAEIPGFAGVWASHSSLELCRRELQEVLEEWILLKLREREVIPSIKGANVRIREVHHAA